MYSIEELLKIFTYDPDSGEVHRIKKTGANGRVGLQTRTCGSGYICMGYRGGEIKAHRLAWLFMTGEWPYEVDHIDRDRTNNVWTNLRLADDSLQAINRTLNSPFGIGGVCWDKQSRKYKAYLNVNRKRVLNQNVPDFFEACCLRKTAENIHHNPLLISEAH